MYKQMNKIYRIFISAIVLIVLVSTVQAYISPTLITQWQKIIGGQYTEVPNSLIKVTDGYIIAGYTMTYGNNNGNGKGWLLKTYLNGTQQWNKTYFNNRIQNEVFTSVQQMNNTLIITGSQLYNGNRNALVVKTDMAGKELWNKTYGERNSADKNFYIASRVSDGYIFIGNKYSFDTTKWYVWIIKTDNNGKQLWEKTIHPANSLEINTAIKTSDNKYIIVGQEYPHGLLIKIDANGNIIWEKLLYAYSSYLNVKSIISTMDGNYLLTGYKYEPNYDSQGWIAKMNPNSDILWQKTYGDTLADIFYSAQEISYNKYVIAGSTESYGNGAYGSPDGWIITISDTSKPLMSVTYGGNRYDDINIIKKLYNNEYIITGTTENNRADIMLMKLSIQ